MRVHLKQFSALVYEPFPVLWFFSPLCGLLCAELKGGQFFNEVSGADQENSKKEPNSLRNVSVHLHPQDTAHPLFSTFATHCHSSLFVLHVNEEGILSVGFRLQMQVTAFADKSLLSNFDTNTKCFCLSTAYLLDCDKNADRPNDLDSNAIFFAGETF